MKLVNPNFLFQIEFSENKITNIIIESPQILEEFLRELYQQYMGNTGRWVLSENSIPLDIKKYCEIIINPFCLNVNDKKILGKLYDDIKKNANNSEMYVTWNEVSPYLTDVIEQLIQDFDYKLKYDSDIDMKDLFKVMNLRVDIDSTDDFELLIDYINLYNSILGIKLFVLVNIKSYYSSGKLKYLYEQAFYKKYNLLLIDNNDIDVNNDCEIKYIIDKDGCVIY